MNPAHMSTSMRNPEQITTTMLPPYALSRGTNFGMRTRHSLNMALSGRVCRLVNTSWYRSDIAKRIHSYVVSLLTRNLKIASVSSHSPLMPKTRVRW